MLRKLLFYLCIGRSNSRPSPPHGAYDQQYGIFSTFNSPKKFALRSLTFGNLWKYRMKNYNRIAARGHDPVLVKTIFIDAAKSLDAMSNRKQRSDRNNVYMYASHRVPPLDTSQSVRMKLEQTTLPTSTDLHLATYSCLLLTSESDRSSDTRPPPPGSR